MHRLSALWKPSSSGRARASALAFFLMFHCLMYYALGELDLMFAGNVRHVQVVFKHRTGLFSLMIIEAAMFTLLLRGRCRAGQIWWVGSAVALVSICLLPFSMEVLTSDGLTLHLFWPPDFTMGAEIRERMQKSPLSIHPPYIASCARTMLSALYPTALLSSAAQRLLGVDAIFVVYYPPLGRRAALEKILARAGLDEDVNWVAPEEPGIETWGKDKQCCLFSCDRWWSLNDKGKFGLSDANVNSKSIALQHFWIYYQIQVNLPLICNEKIKVLQVLHLLISRKLAGSKLDERACSGRRLGPYRRNRLRHHCQGHGKNVEGKFHHR
jgi:hypothetical protein